jgi:hypothetical protein
VPKFGNLNFAKLEYNLPQYPPEKEDYRSPDSSEDDMPNSRKYFKGRKALVSVDSKKLDTLRGNSEHQNQKTSTFANTMQPVRVANEQIPINKVTPEIKSVKTTSSPS